MEINENLVHEAFREGGLLAQHYPGFSARPQQVELANGIQKAIQNKEVFLGEAPTGVGKSLACLVPAAEIILKENAPVVVVTSSIVLQEQYFKEVIPKLEQVLDANLQSVLIKGRSNYLCMHKFNDQVISGGDLFSTDERKAVMDWACQTRGGDVSELDFVPKRNTWSDFAAMDDHECAGKRCSAFEVCHYYRQRKRVLGAKLIVCNYHYFLTAINADGMLPPDIRVVIMDEGHEISDIAKDFQERIYTTFVLRGATDAFLKAGKIASAQHASIHMELNVHYLVEVMELSSLKGSLDSMCSKLALFFYDHKEENKDNYTLSLEARVSLQPLAYDHYRLLIDKMWGIQERLSRYGLPSEEQYRWHELYTAEEIKWHLAIQKFRDALGDRIFFLQCFFEFRDEASTADALFGEETVDDDAEPLPPPLRNHDETVIYWMEAFQENSVSLHIKPSMAAPLMSSVLDTEYRSYTPIIVSATLAVNGAFEHLKSDLGIQVPTRELVVGSPFDLTNNLLWFLPQGTPAGNDKSHLMFAAQQMLDVVLALHGRTLCLFTSKRALVETTNFFRRNLPDSIKVLAQEEYPRQKMVEMMKRDPNTVIMGTRSFFTGIDIPGQNLSAVLLDKIPFPMIGDPVNDYLMGLPSGFFKFSLPHAIVTLKQAFGRGNRTATDKCVVAVFDGRLSTAGYKGIIFNSFAFQVTATRDWKQVEAFLNTIER